MDALYHTAANGGERSRCPTRNEPEAGGRFEREAGRADTGSSGDEVYGDFRFERLAGISTSLLYNLRQSKTTDACASPRTRTKLAAVTIGERRRRRDAAKPALRHTPPSHRPSHVGGSHPRKARGKRYPASSGEDAPRTGDPPLERRGRPGRIATSLNWIRLAPSPVNHPLFQARNRLEGWGRIERRGGSDA